MSLATQDPFVDGLNALVNANKPGCVLGKWIASLSDVRADALEKALASPVRSPELLAYLKGHGYAGSRTVLKEHRAGTCACVR